MPGLAARRSQEAELPLGLRRRQGAVLREALALKRPCSVLPGRRPPLQSCLPVSREPTRGRCCGLRGASPSWAAFSLPGLCGLLWPLEKLHPAFPCRVLCTHRPGHLPPDAPAQGPLGQPVPARYAAKVTRSPQLPSKRSTACLPAQRRHGLRPHGAPRSPASEAGLAWKVPVTDGCPAVRLPCGQAASSQPPCGVGRGDRATGQGRASTSPSPHTDPRGTPRPGPALRGAATGRPAA